MVTVSIFIGQRELRAPYLPSLAGFNAYRDEVESTKAINIQLGLLVMYLDNFAAAISLFERFPPPSMLGQGFPPDFGRLSERQLCIKYRYIAARDGAMTIFHFSKALEALRQEISNNRTIAPQLDHSEIRGAARAFRQQFPNAGSMRHAVAHDAEILSTEKKRGEHALGEPVENANMYVTAGSLVSGALAGNIYSTTFEGNFISYAIEISTWEKLRDIVATVFSEIERAEAAARKAGG